MWKKGDYFYVKAYDGGYYKLSNDQDPYPTSSTSVTKSWTFSPYDDGCTFHKDVAALCYYDDYGSCRGHSWYTGGGAKVSKSCYASVFGGGKSG